MRPVSNEYTDVALYWQVVYQAGDDGTISVPTETYIWDNEDGGDYADGTEGLTAAVEDYKGSVTNTFDDFVAAAKTTSSVIIEAMQKLFPQVDGHADQFACVNVASVVKLDSGNLELASASLCVTGDGAVIVATGYGLPEATVTFGFTTNGQPATDVLMADAFTVSVGDGFVGGIMYSLPSLDSAVFSGVGVSLTPVGVSATYGVRIGTIGVGEFGPFGGEGGG